MADLVTIQHSDGTNDGSGPSTVIKPPQADNALDGDGVNCVVSR